MQLGRAFQLLLSGLLIATFSGCGPEKDKLVVSLASSLTIPMQQLVKHHRDEGPEYQVLLNTGSSGALAQQILHGARVDLFLSANTGWTQTLVQKGLISSSDTLSFLGNQLIVIVPLNSNLPSFDGFLQDSSLNLATGSFESVPVGEYTRAWLRNAGHLQTMNNRLIFLKNEQQVLRAVENHHVAAGVVYRSSLKHTDKVRLLHEPSSNLYPTIRYSFSITRDSSQPQKAREFLLFLKSKEAGKIWIENGFEVMDE